jgi:hypothetical protein
MSRHPFLDIDDRDPIELAADDFDRPTRSELRVDDFEPDDFDDIRIAERYGEQRGGHFAFENDDHPDFEDVF